MRGMLVLSTALLLFVMAGSDYCTANAADAATMEKTLEAIDRAVDKIAKSNDEIIDLNTQILEKSKQVGIVAHRSGRRRPGP